MIETVHVVFKTHLDLGFTGLAATVLDEYVENWIPRALDLAEELADSPDASFVWTTGSWLIRAFLDRADPAARARLERSIADGRIVWHALPCSTHTELMDGPLVDYGLSLSARLDARFGKTTIAAKMTDVPGHTIGLVPHLARAGVRYLHLGVNPVSALPDVPDLFRWRAPDGSEVVVHYQGDYGSTATGSAFTRPGLDHALYLAHTNDNHGPPSRDEVVALFGRLRAQYPGARVVASTLDAFAAAVDGVRSELPVVEDEIGDTWIHGPAADPLLLSRFRALLRARSALVSVGSLDVGSPEYDAFSDPLLLVAEHTWGEDQKVFLPDFVSYDAADFARARAQDLVPGSTRTFSAFEASWEEQRTRIDQALAALSPANRSVVERELAQSEPDASPSPGSSTAGHGAPLPERLGRFEARFADDGSLAVLVDEEGRVLFDPDHTAGGIAYSVFDADDYDGWVDDYCRDLPENAEWALPDLTRFGLRAASKSARHATYRPAVVSSAFVADEEADVVRLEAVLPAEAVALFGAPERVTLAYRFVRAARRIELDVTTHGKRATRLPEATTIGFLPAGNGLWSLDKLGTRVDPGSVVRGGNRRLHSVESLRFAGADGTLDLVSVDAPIVAVGRPELLRLDREAPDSSDGVHVILHDNLWSTNFRQWFDDDLVYRFRLAFS